MDVDVAAAAEPADVEDKEDVDEIVRRIGVAAALLVFWAA